jgi:hypothetical protein
MNHFFPPQMTLQGISVRRYQDIKGEYVNQERRPMLSFLKSLTWDDS